MRRKGDGLVEAMNREEKQAEEKTTMKMAKEKKKRQTVIPSFNWGGVKVVECAE